MKKRIIAVLGILAVLSSILLVGCSESGSETKKETIGIIGAMDDEVASLKKAADIQKTTKIAEMEFCEGTLGGRNVVIVKCGMGKVNAGIKRCLTNTAPLFLPLRISLRLAKSMVSI